MTNTKLYKVTCTRCSNEKGLLVEYKHVMGGVCFKCNGKGYVLNKTKPVKKKELFSYQVGANTMGDAEYIKEYITNEPVGSFVESMTTVKATSEKEAYKKAFKQLSRSKYFDKNTIVVKLKEVV